MYPPVGIRDENIAAPVAVGVAGRERRRSRHRRLVAAVVAVVVADLEAPVLPAEDVQVRGDAQHDLVARQLAACVQVLGPMTSFYTWRDEVQRNEEWLLLAKTIAIVALGLLGPVGRQDPVVHLLTECGIDPILRLAGAVDPEGGLVGSAGATEGVGVEPLDQGGDVLGRQRELADEGGPAEGAAVGRGEGVVAFAVVTVELRA